MPSLKKVSIQLLFLFSVFNSAAAISVRTFTKTNEISPDTVNRNTIVNEAAFFAMIDWELPQLKAVKQAVDRKDWTGAKEAWGYYLQHRKSPRWIWSRHDKQAIRSQFQQQFGGVNYYNTSADKTLKRTFTFNGVTLKLNKTFDWRSGSLIWEQLFSRHDVLAELGYAYVLTGNKEYARDFNELIKGWVKQHPVLPDITKTWNGRDKAATSLETGLRMERWMDIMEAFLDAPEFDAEARYLMTKSMMEQMRYLDGWIVNYRIGNWQMAEAAGMSYVGIMFPEFKISAAFREKGFRFLKMHMDRDVYSDGTHIEITPSYHVGVLEQYIRVARVIQNNGYTVLGLLDRHEKMFDFILNITKPDLRYPGMGDARDASAKNTLGLGALFYNRSDFRWVGGDKAHPSWLWMLGPHEINKYKTLAAEEPKLRSVLLPDSKYAMLRTGWKVDDKYLMLDIAPSLGSHSHGDRLQVLAYAGRDLLIDPGQYSYGEPLAEYFKTAKAHNILVIDGKEQEKVDPVVKSWHIGKELEYVSGKLDLKNMSHQRTVVFAKPNYWIVVDHIESKEKHEYMRQFQFPVGSMASINGLAAFTNFASGMNIMVYPAENSSASMVSRPIPALSNTTVNARQATFTTHGGSMVLGTILFPFASKDLLPKIEQLNSASGTITLQLTFPNGQIDQIAVAATETNLKIGNHASTGTVLYVRKKRGGVEEIIK